MIIRIITQDVVDFNLPVPEREEQYYQRKILSYLKRLKTGLANGSAISVHAKMMDIYCDWHERTMGFKPKINAAEGKALKQIVAYLLGSHENNQDLAVDAWEGVLSSYQNWDKWHQKQTKITQINSNLQNIIKDVRSYSSPSSGSGLSSIR